MNLIPIFLIFTLGFSTGYKLDHKLLQNITSKETVNLLLSFSQGTDNVEKAILKQALVNDRTSKISAIRESLLNEVKISQERVSSFLTKSSHSFKSLWITNQLYVQNADLELLMQLTDFEEIQGIAEERIFHLARPELGNSDIPTPRGEWGVDKINSEAAVELLLNVTGNMIPEVRVGVMSTG
jgi:hypothetical protein